MQNTYLVLITSESIKYIKWLKESLIGWWHKALSLSWWKTEFHWTDSILCSGEADLPATICQQQSSQFQTVVSKWVNSNVWTIEHWESTAQCSLAICCIGTAWLYWFCTAPSDNADLCQHLLAVHVCGKMSSDWNLTVPNIYVAGKHDRIIP